MSARTVAATLLALLTGAEQTASAQSVRVSGATSVRYIEIRTLVRDSVPAGETEGSGLLRQQADGRIVRCIPGDEFCHDTRAGPRAFTVPVIHDVEASAWGFGVGARVFGQLRARTGWDRSGLWPRGADALELVAAYAELDRERVRVRAGRQWKVSGLGFYNFDGVAVAVRPAAPVWLEAHAGRSLVRGLNEPRTSGALQAIEALAPSAEGFLAGLQARYRPNARAALSATYQVDFRGDGGGLHSELAALDGVLQIGRGSVESAVEVDLAGRALNEARVRMRAPPVARTALHLELRRYRPYFELWTIWGAFSPVGFDEAQAGATWADARGRVIVRGEASYRSYGESGSDGVAELRSTGWGYGVGASWLPDRSWRIDGSYRVEVGVGAARRDGHAGVLRQLGDAGTIALQALAFQRLYEFRLSEGTVLGVGAEASLRVSDRARVFAGATGYRHIQTGTVPDADWTQRRASMRLQWTLGSEPGVTGGV